MKKYILSLLAVLFCSTFGALQAMAATPDLIVKDIKLLSDCTVEFTFKNIGNGSIPDSGYVAVVQFYKNNKPWGGFSLSAIDKNKVLKAPGGQVTYKFYNKTGGGTHTISAHIDLTDKITESNENNNRLDEELTCTSMPQDIGPDFAIVNILQEPGCRFSFVIKNKGTQPIPAHQYKRATGLLIKVRKDGKVYQNVWLADADPQKKAQKPGGYVKYIFPGQSPFKAGGVKIHVLGESYVAGWDADLHNNHMTRTLYCRLPDLYISRIYTSPLYPRKGHAFKVYAVFNKQGGPRTLRNVDYSFRIGGETYPKTGQLHFLSSSRIVRVRKVTLNRSGRFRVTVLVDQHHRIREIKETNNKRIYTIRIR